MSTRLSDVAQRALSAISSAQHQDADDFVSSVTRSFRASQSRRAPRARGMRRLLDNSRIRQLADCQVAD